MVGASRAPCRRRSRSSRWCGRRRPAASLGPRAADKPSRSASSGAPSRASPSRGRRRAACETVPRPVAERREIRDQADVPEHRRDGRVGRDGEHVPDQRATELRPHPHPAGIWEQPVPHRAADWRRGYMPAQMTAKVVIASAKRLMDFAPVSFSNRRMRRSAFPRARSRSTKRSS